MLKLCESIGDLSRLSPSPYSARIRAQFAAYGAEGRFALFWCDGGGTAVSLVDGVAALECGTGCDYDEVGSFLRFIGAGTVCCTEEAAKKLGLNITSSSFTVKYVSRAANGGHENARDYKEIYLLLKKCGFEMGEYGDFLADLCSRIRAGSAETAARYCDGRLSATASALFIGEKCALLGAVATEQDFRGRGFASALVSSLAADQAAAGREVFLHCRNDSLLGFYEKIGFECAGRWAQAKL